jgi:hypothetical protein
MCSLPPVGLILTRFTGGTPDILTIINISIETTPVRWQMKETVMINSKYLRRLIKGYTTPCLRHHGMKGTVG